MPAHGKHLKPTIREACADDLPRLVDFMVSLALHVSGEAPQALKASEHERLVQTLNKAMESPDMKIVVAEVPGSGLVGMGDISVWISHGIWEQAHHVTHSSAIIDDIWVEPEFRGTGVFKAILNDLVDFADQRGAQELILEYAASNEEAAAAWTKLGFVTTGVRAAAYTQHIREALE